MLQIYWDWLKQNKESLSVIFSSAALIISLGTFWRSWRKDRRELARAEKAKLPLISYQVSRAVEESLYIDEPRESIPGWKFHISLQITNRFEVPCYLEKITGKSSKGDVRFGLTLGSMKSTQDHRALDVDRFSTEYRVYEPGKAFRHLSFTVHISSELSKRDIEVGIPLNLAMQFVLQESPPRSRKLNQKMILQSGLVVEKKL